MTEPPGEPWQVRRAYAMGARAARLYAATGRLSPNPYRERADLAAAWRRGFLYGTPSEHAADEHLTGPTFHEVIAERTDPAQPHAGDGGAE